MSANLVQSELAGWYKKLELEGDAEKIQARFSGIKAVASIVTKNQIEALVRLAFGTKRAAATAELDRIRELFTDEDDEFPQQGNNLELQILAAASLIQMQGKLPSLAPLAVSITACAGARKTNLPMDLVQYADVLLGNRSEANRLRNSIKTNFSELKSLDFSEIQTKTQQQPDFNALAASFADMQAILKKSFAEQAKQSQGMLDGLIANARMMDEELNMLWWLTGHRSEDFDCDFASLSVEAQPLVLAKELADLTELLPGPASVKALLSRAGLKERKKIKLTSAVNAVEKAWAQKHFPGDNYSPVTTPVHFALQRSFENDGGMEWIGNWSGVTGIPANFEINPLALGLQFYRERVFLTLA